ncbi:MAG TPA: TerB family tellurite resistance protein [Candidatus Limnocylindrales bacterium]|nr:TerB family tellurite resistance protein [Candidatus Limnocylindrales bacterium]
MTLLGRFLRGEAGGSTSPPGATERETETIRRIVGSLEAMPPERAAYVAGFAYVLARVAYADLHISEQETAEMERIVADFGGLPEPLAVLVVEIAKTQARLEGATEDYLVTRRFREVSSAEQRERVLHCLYAVASAAGDTVSAEETAEIRQIASELGFTLPELNVIRRHYADRLAALQRRPAGDTA